MYLNDVKRTRLNSLVTHYSANGAIPREFHYRGRNDKAVKIEEARRIVTFLKSVSAIFALALPGRVPGLNL